MAGKNSYPVTVNISVGQELMAGRTVLKRFSVKADSASAQFESRYPAACSGELHFYSRAAIFLSFQVSFSHPEKSLSYLLICLQLLNGALVSNFPFAQYISPLAYLGGKFYILLGQENGDFLLAQPLYLLFKDS